MVTDYRQMKKSIIIQSKPLFDLTCAYDEGCLSSDASNYVQNPHYFERLLLRFTSRMYNRGTQNFLPFQTQDKWEWHNCHNHYHSMERFSDYDLTGKCFLAAYLPFIILRNWKGKSSFDTIYNTIIYVISSSINRDKSHEIHHYTVTLTSISFVLKIIEHIYINCNFPILDSFGFKRAEGHKASFCLEDSICDRGVKQLFNCRNDGAQGISVNCADNYKWDIDCQWVDMTTVAYGKYTLRVTLNPLLKVFESDYSNNVVSCGINYISETQIIVDDCTVGKYQ